MIITAVFSVLSLCAAGQSSVCSVDGLKYELYDDGHAVLVKSLNAEEYPSGDISIPEYIEADGKTYAVTGIGRRALSWTESGQRVILPKSIKYLEESAISSNAIVELPETVSILSHFCLSGNVLPEKLNMADIEYIGAKALYSVNTRTVALGKTLFGLGAWAFADSEVTEISFAGGNPQLPQGLPYLSNFAFSNMKIRELKLPEWPDMEIGDCVCSECPNLERIVFPEINTIEWGRVADVPYTWMTPLFGYWFVDCPSLREVVCMGAVPPEITNMDYIMKFLKEFDVSDKFRVTDNVEECVLKVPAGSEELYRAHSVWGDFKTIYGFENGDYTSIAVPEMTDAAFRAPEYYNLQGIRVALPVKGQMYIRVSGTRSDKIVY